MQRSNSGVFWPVLVLVATVDFCTKALARTRLLPERMPAVLATAAPFPCAIRAAFGLHVRPYSAGFHGADDRRPRDPGLTRPRARRHGALVRSRWFGGACW